jgi:hypothetical protein
MRLPPWTNVEIDLAIAKLDVAINQFREAMDYVNGRINGRQIDKWLKLYRQAGFLREDLVDRCADLAQGAVDLP